MAYTLTAKLTCDQCGKHVYETAPKGRVDSQLQPPAVRETAARVKGFVNVHGLDLCEFCRPGGPRKDGE